MPLSEDNKKKMYGLEKASIIIVIALAILIFVLVLYGSKRTDKVDDSEGNVLQSYVNVNSDSAPTNEGVSAPNNSLDIDFTTIIVSNTELLKGDLIVANSSYKLSNDISEDLKIPENDAYGLTNYSVKLLPIAITGIEKMILDFQEAKEVNTSYIVTKGYDSADSNGDHSTGLGFNLVAQGSGIKLGEGELSWYYDNCWKYGYILRYPSGKELATGAEYEFNHFRYVGIPHALYMYRKNLALEEYIEDLKNLTSPQHPLNLDVGNEDSMYMAYAVAAENGNTTNISVPAEGSGWEYSVSGTNCGYFVVTIHKIS